MKIAFLISSLNATGPEIFTRNLLHGLSEYKDVECDVFYLKKTSNNVSQVNIKNKCTKISLFQKVDFSEYDIIHSTGFRPDIYVAIHKLYKRKQCVSSMHNFMKEDLSQVRGKALTYIICSLWKNALNKIHNIVVSSSAQKKYYEEVLSPNHSYTLIPYGIPELPPLEIDKEEVQLLETIKSKYQVLLGCGVLIKRKGYYQMINYLGHNKDAVAILIGNGPCKGELERQAEDLGVSDRVFFLGFKKDSYRYYNFGDVFCLTSNSEGFGLGMLEALELSKPVVCSNLPIYRDYFDEDSVGLFNYGNQSEFNEKTDYILSNINYFAKSSRNIYEKYFKLNKMADKHIKLYKMLNNAKQGG